MARSSLDRCFLPRSYRKQAQMSWPTPGNDAKDSLFLRFSAAGVARQVLFPENRRLRILGLTRVFGGCQPATVPQERSPADVIRRSPGGQVVFPAGGC